MAKKRHKAEVDRHGASRDLLFHQSHSRYWDWTSVPTRGRGNLKRRKVEVLGFALGRLFLVIHPKPLGRKAGGRWWRLLASTKQLH